MYPFTKRSVYKNVSKLKPLRKQSTVRSRRR